MLQDESSISNIVFLFIFIFIFICNYYIYINQIIFYITEKYNYYSSQIVKFPPGDKPLHPRINSESFEIHPGQN